MAPLCCISGSEAWYHRLNTLTQICVKGRSSGKQGAAWAVRRRSGVSPVLIESEHCAGSG